MLGNIDVGRNTVLTVQANIPMYGNAGYLEEKVNCSVCHKYNMHKLKRLEWKTIDILLSKI